MLPILPLIIVLGISSAAFIYFWNYIRDYLNGTFRDFIQKHFGMELGEQLGMFLTWIDDRVVSVRTGAKKFVNWFRSRVLKTDTTYKKISPNKATCNRESYVKCDDGRILHRTEEQEISYDELPQAIRHEMIRQKTTEAQMDNKQLIEKKIQERAEEDNFQELLVTSF
ncbi:MAG: hypothetical protein LBE12_18590 [Planctomycetaceae bacterium]|jgi:hypothetical protein|nr:hypothetical protein [Planctomycetaceae bacterium]